MKPGMLSRGPISLSCVLELIEKGAKRSVELFVAPKGIVRYTLDGSEPREGTTYDKAVEIGAGEVLLRAFAEAGGLEAKEDFRFAAKGKKGVQIDDVKAASIVSRTGRKLDSRAKTFESLKQAAEKSVTFEGVVINVGQGSQIIGVTIGDIQVNAGFYRGDSQNGAGKVRTHDACYHELSQSPLCIGA